MEGRALFLDASAPGDGWGQSLAFGEPLALRRAETLAQVPGVIRWAEAEALAGRWAASPQALAAAPGGLLWCLRQPLRSESASQVRARIAAGDDWAGLVPAAVADYIRAAGLYAAAPAAPRAG